MTIGVVIAAAGRGSRLGAAAPKAFLPLGGRTLLARCLAPFLAHPEVRAIAVAVPDPGAAGIVPEDPRLVVVRGGSERQDSVRAALEALGRVEVILVHDAARPFVDRALIDRVAGAALRHGAAIPALPVPDTLKRVDASGQVIATVPRDDLHLAQTPQGFRADLLRSAHADARDAGVAATDDAILVERAGTAVVVVPGDPLNIKITTPGDLRLAEVLAARQDGAHA